MRKFREWMHTTGRNKVIAVVFFVIRNIGGTSEGKAYVESVREITGLGTAGGANNRYTGTVPKSAKEEIIGGDSIGRADPDTTMIPGDAIHPSTTPKVGNSSKQKESEQKQSKE